MAFGDGGVTVSTPGGGSTNYPGGGGSSNPSPTPPNAQANQPGAGGFNNPYRINPYSQYDTITGNLRAAQQARADRLQSQGLGAEQDAMSQGQQAQDFARAQLGKIGGFEGTYGIGLQSSIANRTDNNIKAIRRATQEAIDQGDYELQSKLADLGYQQIKLLTDLNTQAFDQYKQSQDESYRQKALAQNQAQFDTGQFNQVNQYGLTLAEQKREFDLNNARLLAEQKIQAAQNDKGRWQYVQTGTDEYGLPIMSPFDTSTGRAGSVGSVSIPQNIGSQQNQLAWRNNNPGNLKYVGQTGATLGDGNFARFSSADAGYAALINQVKLDQSRGYTIGGYINKFAPASENNTKAYINRVTSFLSEVTGKKVSQNDPLSKFSPENIASIQANIESGTKVGQSISNFQKFDQSSKPTVQTPDISNPDPEVVKKAFLNALSDQTANKRTPYIQNFKTYLANGDLEGAKQFVKQTALEGAPVEMFNKITGLQDAASQLSEVQNLLTQYGDTGVLKGGLENALRKIGNTQDPRLVELKGRISQVLFNYRKAMTGVQFSPQEAAQYEKMFPNYSQEPPVNQATINALQAGFSATTDNFYKQKIGAREFEAIYGKTAVPSTFGTSQNSSQVQQYQLPNGTIVKLQPDGTYK